MTRLLDMKPIREHIDAILIGWKLISNNRVFRNIRLGAERFLTLFWLFIGGIGPYRLMRYMYALVGAINLVLITQSDAPSGLDIITQNITMQYGLAFSMIAYAMLLEQRNIFLLTMGSICAAIYASFVGYGTLIGVIDLRGMLVVVYLAGFAGAIMVASYSAFSDHQTNQKLEEHLAKFEGWRESMSTTQKRNQQYRDLLIKHGIDIPEII